MSIVENDLLLERQLCFGLSVAARSVIAAYKPVLAELNLGELTARFALPAGGEVAASAT